MSFDISSVVAQAAAQTDMREAQSGGGGGDYTPPAAGACRLRFISYVEVGQHERMFQGTAKLQNQVQLVFELSGPKHQPTVNQDGTKSAHRITVTENLSLNEKAHFFKIFRAMNYDGQATHIAQLLGKSFLGTVFHDVRASDSKVFASLKSDTGYSIRAPQFEDPETGEMRRVEADPQISETRCFLWDYASKEMWDSLYIDGEYPERKDEKTGQVTMPAKSKNVIQHKIMAAKNWQGSPMQQILSDGGELDLSDQPVNAPATTAANDANADPLADIA